MKLATQRAEALMKRYGLSYEHLLGARFAINVAIASTIVWHSLDAMGVSKPIWAIASMIAASEPEITEAWRMLRCRIINVTVGCTAGLLFISVGGANAWVLPVALATTVLVSAYLVKVKTMWRQAPITAAIVIASGITAHSPIQGVGQGMLKVAEVLFGCFVGVLVSWSMCKVWLIRPPPSNLSAPSPPAAAPESSPTAGSAWPRIPPT